ncbi:MAG: B12-binding domain-containing radical SAM protein [Rhodocyclaceae bacterium]|nr:B12-binding domain-containing radical SAM protein [Rhodocyclaceae bacterium]MBX3668897.1 B12-binding domain-containing radical SAM protein [Rhodocyclaceae bacterium]
MRVLLINPPSPERLGAPLLGLQYVAAALLRTGCEVRVIDAAARLFPHDHAWIVDQVRAFAPRFVGMSLFTRWVWHAYRLAADLKDCGFMLVAGGAHATVCPEEPLAHGFEVVLSGEAELSIVQFVQALRAGETPAHVGGSHWRDAEGLIAHGPPVQFVENLDALASPLLAQPLFEAAWYDARAGAVTPGGVVTSRGCPARCTFCANAVTGRGFRYRSAESVVDELEDWHAQSGANFFPFWDDAFTAKIPRLTGLCEAFTSRLSFPLQFSAITRAGLVTPDLLRMLRRAGLVHVNFGVESGDDEILRIIKKGLRTEQVVRALEYAKAEDLSTACNFMLGFPDDTPASLERTLRFMQRIAPLVDTFSTLGVVIPFPGTALYDMHHETFGFTEWWLQERCSHYQPLPACDGGADFMRLYADDPTLELDFFRYDAPTRALIRECLRFKAEHNLRRMGMLDDPVFAPRPVLAA